MNADKHYDRLFFRNCLRRKTKDRHLQSAERKLSPRILYVAEKPFKIKANLKRLLQTDKSDRSHTNRLALPEILKAILQAE